MADPPSIAHVFVLMLENHSFDNIFAFSGIPGIEKPPPNANNVYGNPPITYPVGSPAPVSMPTDPGHEFLDVLEQLCGPDATYTWGQPYPQPITDSGFASNYATSATEKTGLPTPDEIGDIMLCFDTQAELPVIYQLATEFALCDQWFSSLPGPTWPNRFFLHGASSSGWDDSPSSAQILAWEKLYGFTYNNGSIYEALTKAGRQWRLYSDKSGNLFGGMLPQVLSLSGIHSWDINDFADFASDLAGSYPYEYTFIEPNYGDVLNNTYEGGSSQHPMDGVAQGEVLIKATYEAIRNSSLWDTSLLIVTYDEHGGFYDSGTPGVAPPPLDNSPVGHDHGFTFSHYGVRVPAVVVSPLIPKPNVDHTVYDHTSVLATIERLYNVPPLTNRDQTAADVLGLLSLSTPRTDCPETLNDPAPAPAGAPAVAEVMAPEISGQPLPESGNIQGSLGILLKMDLELAGGDRAAEAAAIEKFKTIRTRGDAHRYATEVHAKTEAAKAERS